MQTTVPPLELVSDPQETTTNLQTTTTGSLPTSAATDLQADSLDTVRTVVVPTVIVSLILVVTVLVVVIIVLCRGRSRKRVQGIVYVSCRWALSVGGGLVSACIDLLPRSITCHDGQMHFRRDHGSLSIDNDYTDWSC